MIRAPANSTRRTARSTTSRSVDSGSSSSDIEPFSAYICIASCSPPPGGGEGAGLDGHAIGRSRGGLTAKIHLACDGRGRSLAILIAPVQRHDGICAQSPLKRIRVSHLGPGRPRCRPAHVIADKAYSSRGFRAYLRKRGVVHVFPEKADRQ
ncbi:transposase [Streptomyces sp. NPDC053495]